MTGARVRHLGRVGLLVVAMGVLAVGAAAASSFYGEVIHIKHTTLLYDVGCGYQSTCIGVGTKDNSKGVVVNAVTRAVTDVAGPNYISNIDCPKKNYCIAVGTAFSGKSPGGEVVQIDGGSPRPAEKVPFYLYAIDCASATSCWAPGAAIGSNGYPKFPVVVHLVNGSIPKGGVLVPGRAISHNYYPTLFTAGEGGGAINCFGEHCIIAGKLSDHGPGALFSLENNSLTRLATDSNMTALAGLSCFNASLCRIVGYANTTNGSNGILATYNAAAKYKIDKDQTLDNGLSRIGCLVFPDMRCFAFGYEGTYPDISQVVVKINKAGYFVDQKVIEPNINGVFCAHACIAAGSVGQYPNAQGVLFDKFVH